MDKTNYGFGITVIALLGVLLTYVGLGLWLWGFISLGSSFALLTQARKLVTRGAYKYFKHPIYIGIFLTFLGIAVAKGSVWGLLFNLLITTPMNIIRAKNEENALAKKFSA